MTILEALNYATDTINQLPQDKQTKEVVRILNNLKKRDVFIHWDKESIIQKLYDYEKENGRPPTTTNLCEIGMPNGVTIQSYFHIKPSLLLKQLFPNSNSVPKKISNKYGFTTEEDWLNCFAEQFKNSKVKDVSSRQYNYFRDKNTPSWETIAKRCGINGWRELMKRANVSYSKKKETTTVITKVESHSPSMNKLIEINEERQRLNNELSNILK